MPWVISDAHDIYDFEGWRTKCPPTLAILPPSLTSLDLHIALPSDDHMRVPGHIAPGALDRLTSLDINSTGDWNPVASLLRYCSKLQHLSIHRDHAVEHHYTPDMDNRLLLQLEPINLPHLRSLEVALKPPRDVHGFLRLFRASNLKIIRTRQERRATQEERYLWNSLLSLRLLTPGVNQLAIRHLTLFARSSTPPATVPAAELHDILSDLPPPLLHLRLENLTFNAGELLGLHKTRSTSTSTLRFLPSLHCFEIADPGPEFDLIYFLELVKGVCRTPPALGAFPALRKIVFTFTVVDTWEYPGPDRVFLDQYRDEATLRELETSFGIVMDLIAITTWD
ncbi:hypothetical protein FA13DRAFT_1740490 [Coprinellus micaceus]|uniref:F-box domain-containing protein n=1 Tax=Coprinellus micaceus TaxID=71717 RepID=A0A4Y7SMA3_COPMI|nr:hypothetical protein FA13DRAFT_1740490 [Coprinellus micaceus]